MAVALWRDISLVWLTFLCFIGLIIPVALSIIAVKGMHVAVDRTPRLLRQVQGYSRMMRTQVDAASVQVAKPVIKAHKESTRIVTVLDRLRHQPKSPSTGE